MKGRKYAKSDADLAAENAVSELFADSDDDDQFDFDGIEYATFGRFLAAVTDLGGVVTIYRKSDSDDIIFSARVGEHRKSWGFDNADLWNSLMRGIADQYHLAAHKFKMSKKGSNSVLKTTETDEAVSLPQKGGKRA